LAQDFFYRPRALKDTPLIKYYTTRHLNIATLNRIAITVE
jgi:hypothetical protein